MLCLVALVRTDVPHEHIASIIRVTRFGEVGTMLAVTSNQRTQHTAKVLLVYIVKVILLLMVSWPVYPSIRPPSVTRDQFFSLNGNYHQAFADFYAFGSHSDEGMGL
jgi:hypothetical protein